MKKTIIQEDEESFTVSSVDTHLIGVLEEELDQLGIKGVCSSYRREYASLEIPKYQGDDVTALDKLTQIQNSVDNLRPTGYTNWETWAVVNHLQNVEQIPYSPEELKIYIHTKKAPEAFYWEFESSPIGNPHIIMWEEVAEALKD